MTNMLSGKSSLAYQGTNATNPPNLTYHKVDPTPNNWRGFSLGDLWLNQTTEQAWMLVSLEGNVAFWRELAGGTGTVETLTGNLGGPVGPTANNINVVGDGTSILVTGNPGTSTLTISSIGGGASTFNADAGSASPIAGVINLNGNNNISTSAAGNTVQFSVSGTTLYAVQVGSAAGALTSLPLGTAGQVLTSNGPGLIPSWQNNAGILEISGDISFVTGNNIHLTGETTGGASLSFEGDAGVHMTLHTTDSSFNTFIGGATGNTTLSGNSNTAFGADSLGSLTSGAYNTTCGYFVGNLITSGRYNSSMGAQSLANLTTGLMNNAVGGLALAALSTGSHNNAMGYAVLGTLGSGTYNIAIGDSAGSAYTSNESNNILIGNNGEIGESNIIRIGTQGSGAGQQDETYIAGIYGVTPGGAVQNVTINSAGQLGSTATPPGTIDTINGDTGSVTGNTVAFNATPTAGSSVSFNGNVGHTVMALNVSDALSNTLVGLNAGATGMTGSFNTGLGSAAGNSLSTGANSSLLGFAAGTSITTGSTNTLLGYQAGFHITTGGSNTLIGGSTAVSLTTGSNNVLIGLNTGTSYTSSESSNILIMNSGTVGESHIMRFGTQGTGAGQIEQAYMAGVWPNLVDPTSQQTVIIDNTGKLGASNALPGGGVNWQNVNTANTDIFPNNGYVTIYVATAYLYLPVAMPFGSIVRIVGNSAGLWQVVQLAGQQIIFGNRSTTVGATGYISSTLANDCVELVCVNPGLTWIVMSAVGNITVH